MRVLGHPAPKVDVNIELTASLAIGLQLIENHDNLVAGFEHLAQLLKRVVVSKVQAMDVRVHATLELLVKLLLGEAQYLLALAGLQAFQKAWHCFRVAFF